jgi:hypothetical protein
MLTQKPSIPDRRKKKISFFLLPEKNMNIGREKRKKNRLFLSTGERKMQTGRKKEKNGTPSK